MRLAELQSLSSNKEAVEDAVKRAQDVLGRSPGNADAHSIAGLAELRLGRAPEAEKPLNRRWQNLRHILQASVNLARAPNCPKRMSPAREAVLRSAVTQAPRAPEPLIALGLLPHRR